MKVKFIETKYNSKIKLPLELIKLLPGIVGLFSTVQFIDSIPDVKKVIEAKGKKVILFQPKHSCYKGHILGCNIEEFPEVNGFLYIGDGNFHPIALSIKNNKPVFRYDPFTKKYSELSPDETKKILKKKTIAEKKFYMSEKIGILVSTKFGQNRVKDAILLKKKLTQKYNKICYILISNEIDHQMINNFNFIECFINTACPRISYDDYSKFEKPVIDFGDLPEDLHNN